MKKRMILFALFFSVILPSAMNADSNGEAVTFDGTTNVTAINRSMNGSAQLVIQQNDVDILTIQNTPQGIVPKLQSVCMVDNWLAVVIDFSLSFHYQLYHLEAGVWSLKKEVIFSAMNTRRRIRIALVQMPSLGSVKITYNKGGADSLRKKGIINKDDPEDIFVFSDKGNFKNSSPYLFKSSE